MERILQDRYQKIFTEAFPITESTTIKAQAFKDGKAVGRITTKKIFIHKAAGKRVTYNIEPNSKYSTSDLCLTDCLRGSMTYSKDHWVAYRDSDVDLTIDLGLLKEIEKVTVSLLHSTGSWIFLPLNLSCELSIDGENYKEIGSDDYSEIANKPGKFIKEGSITFNPQQAQFIRIKAKSMRVNPDWHSSSGGKNWIFIDEIIVE